MATSGTTSFNLPVDEIVEKAYEMVGKELESGEDLKQARKSLNLLFIDLQNKGHPLAKLENFTFATSVSTATSYVLDPTVVDVMDVVVTRSSVSTPLKRSSLFDYHKIPNKTPPGLPTQYAIDRDTSSVTMFLYLRPSNTTDIIDYWAVTRVEDVGSYNNNIDFSPRYLPAITIGLAYFLSFSEPNFPLDKRQELKMLYQETLNSAFLEDSSRSSYQITPVSYFK